MCLCLWIIINKSKAHSFSSSHQHRQPTRHQRLLRRRSLNRWLWRTVVVANRNQLCILQRLELFIVWRGFSFLFNSHLGWLYVRGSLRVHKLWKIRLSVYGMHHEPLVSSSTANTGHSRCRWFDASNFHTWRQTTHSMASSPKIWKGRRRHADGEWSICLLCRTSYAVRRGHWSSVHFEFHCVSDVCVCVVWQPDDTCNTFLFKLNGFPGE